MIEGIGGAAAMLLALLTPFETDERSHFGLEAEAARAFEGDELVHMPRWGWTHAVDIDASAAEAWPWVAQRAERLHGAAARPSP